MKHLLKDTMVQLFRTLTQPGHVPKTKIHSFQYISIKFINTLSELVQFYVYKSKTVCQKRMGTLLIKTINCLHLRIASIFLDIKIKNAYDIYRQKRILCTSGINLIPYLKCRIINRPLHIGRLFSSLNLHYNSGTIISLTEHVIDRILSSRLQRPHLLIHKIQIHDVSVRDDLIQKFNHHILAGLLPKHQFEHLVIQ